MCKSLKIGRSNYYTYQEKTDKEDPITKHIKRIFRDSKNTYGTRRIKVELAKEGQLVSRRRVGRIMAKNGLISVYTAAQYKVYKTSCNESEVGNELNREFHNKKPLEAKVSDLTYVRVNTY